MNKNRDLLIQVKIRQSRTSVLLLNWTFILDRRCFQSLASNCCALKRRLNPGGHLEIIVGRAK